MATDRAGSEAQDAYQPRAQRSGFMLAFPPTRVQDTLRGSRDYWSDLYFKALCVGLAGYAALGKGFAYVGLPPVYIGEILLLSGVVVAFLSRCLIASFAALSNVLLACLLLWAAARTIPYIGDYGINAPRDFMVVGYGIFAFVVACLLLERPDRLAWIIKIGSKAAWIYGLVGGVLFFLSVSYVGDLLSWPGTKIRLPYVRPGEAAVHLAGATTFVILGFRRVPLWWGLVLLGNLALITVSRGAMLTYLVATAAAIVLGGRLRRVGGVALVAAAVFLASYVGDIELPLSGGRYISAEQIAESALSIVGTSGEGNLDGTKSWRLEWWEAIRQYTFNGPYFWTGKGFGIGLAEADGFVVGEELGGTTVRSPHNAHMTFLARAGVPGYALWIVLCVTWFGSLMSNMIDARLRGHSRWADFLLWIACYELALIIDASFDVALEGPMLGIWFWSLFGLGVASTMIYRAEAIGALEQRPLAVSAAPGQS